LPWDVPIDTDTFSYYQNLTGFLKGSAALFNLSEPQSLPPSWSRPATAFFNKDSEQLNLTDITRQTRGWNLTSFDKMVTSFVELPSPSDSAALFNVWIALLLALN
jgi:hypothetical protein